MGIPVILDTDIGLDVDDVWALAFLLNCPELDVRLVTTATGDTVYRARAAARLLSVAGREDVPVGIGIPLDASPRTHSQWLDDYQLADYAGPVLRDGVGAICDTVLAADEPVTIIGIGPLPNLAAALAREPEICANARFVGMHGSVRRGYNGVDKPMREYNVRQHALSAQAVFNASWSKTITPLDTCGTAFLDGARFARIAADDAPLLTREVYAAHSSWADAAKDWPLLKDLDLTQRSSVLFDCVAVYLAFAEEYLTMETLPLVVTDDGKTLVNEDIGAPVNCAMDWADKDAFLDLLVDRLT